MAINKDKKFILRFNLLRRPRVWGKNKDKINFFPYITLCAVRAGGAINKDKKNLSYALTLCAVRAGELGFIARGVPDKKLTGAGEK